MKPQKLLLTLIGGWILFIGMDAANGHLGSIGARSLRKPLQVAFSTTKMLRTIVLFLLAASTFLLIARQQKADTCRSGDCKESE